MLAFDPGLNTGWALFSYGSLPATLQAQGVIPDGVDGFIRLEASVLRLVDVVIYEDFVIDGTLTGSWSSEVIGALKCMMYHEAADVPLVKQTRQNKASLFGHKAKTTEKREVERFNWLRDRGFSGVSHELDAITHALFYIKKQEHVPTIKKYWY